jgi:hypothetical protein
LVAGWDRRRGLSRCCGGRQPHYRNTDDDRSTPALLL